MEMQKEIGGDRLSDLPESILRHILSMLPHAKQVVKTSVLSAQSRSLWMSVPVSLDFLPHRIGEKEILDFVTFTHRDLYYWRFCHKIRKFRIYLFMCYVNVKDVDLWVHFATKVVNVECFTLEFYDLDHTYEFPQFAFKNTSMRNLVLYNLKLNPSGSVNWSSLVSLSITHLKNLTEGVMEKALSGCPNLECLEMDTVWGIQQSNWRLEISSVKLKKLILKDDNIQNLDLWFEILAPYVQNLQVLRFCGEIRMQQRNVHLLVTVVLCLNFYSKDGERNLDKEGSYMKELLHSVAHVENLELSPWCIECMSRPALEGWQSPPSSWKFLKLNTNLEQLAFPGIYSFLQRSSYLETLLIDWNNYKPTYLLSWYYKNKVEQSRRFETHKFSCPLLHLKTIKFVNLVRPLNESKFVLPLVKYLLENAIMLEKFDIAAKCKGSDMSRDYVKIEQEILSFPRSSVHASLVFSYQ